MMAEYEKRYKANRKSDVRVADPGPEVDVTYIRVQYNRRIRFSVCGATGSCPQQIFTS